MAETSMHNLLETDVREALVLPHPGHWAEELGGCRAAGVPEGIPGHCSGMGMAGYTPSLWASRAQGQLGRGSQPFCSCRLSR